MQSRQALLAATGDICQYYCSSIMSAVNIHLAAMRLHRALGWISKIITMELSGIRTACCIDKVTEHETVGVSCLS